MKDLHTYEIPFDDIDDAEPTTDPTKGPMFKTFLSETLPEVRERLNTTNRGLFFRALLPLATLVCAVASNL